MRFHQTKAWERMRLAILKRDQYRCTLHARFGKNVPGNIVHHVLPVSLFPEYRLEPWNMITVCSECHNKMHDRGSDTLTEEGRKAAERIIRRAHKDIALMERLTSPPCS